MKKLPKWGKVVLWILGVLVGLVLVIGIGLKIWVSTWPLYKGDGFSVRYPQGWSIQRIDKATGLPDGTSGLLILSNATIPNRNSSQMFSPVGEVFLYFVKTSKDIPGSGSASELQQNMVTELKRTGILPIVVKQNPRQMTLAYVAYLSNNNFVVHGWLDGMGFIYEASLVGTGGTSPRGIWFDILGKLVLMSFRGQ